MLDELPESKVWTTLFSCELLLKHIQEKPKKSEIEVDQLEIRVVTEVWVLHAVVGTQKLLNNFCDMLLRSHLEGRHSGTCEKKCPQNLSRLYFTGRSRCTPGGTTPLYIASLGFRNYKGWSSFLLD
jgi:hypothetical protein